MIFTASVVWQDWMFESAGVFSSANALNWEEGIQNQNKIIEIEIHNIISQCSIEY